MFKFAMRTKVKDTVTGFEGIIISRLEHMNGCKRYEVQPNKLKDGKPIESIWIDEQQLIETGKLKEQKKTTRRRPGGSRVRPPAMNVPK